MHLRLQEERDDYFFKKKIILKSNICKEQDSLSTQTRYFAYVLRQP